MMKNIRISKKLMFGFSFTILFSIVIGTVGIIGMSRLEKANTTLYEKNTLAIQNYGYCISAFQQARVEVRNVLIQSKSGNVEKAKVAKEDYNTLLNESAMFWAEAGKTISSDEEQTLYDESTDVWVNQFMPLNEQIMSDAVDAVTTATVTMDKSEESNAKVVEITNKLIDMKSQEARYVAESNAKLAKLLTMVQLGVIACSIIASVLLTMYIAKLIVSPIKALLTSANEISKGNLNATVVSNNRDEIGVLSRDFGRVNDTLSQLIAGINHMSKAHKDGEMDARIDDNAYLGAYSEVARGINGMVDEYVQIMNDIFVCLHAFGNGNFTVPFKQLPGQQAVINTNIESMRKNLNDIKGEINNLAKSAVDGELSDRADFASYKGDWAELLMGLNSVLDAVVNPVNEALRVLHNISVGNLSLKMNGNYNGDYAVLKNTVNETVDNLSSYIHEISGVLKEMSNNNFKQSISREYVGEFVNMKDSLNMIIDKLNTVMGEIRSAAAQVDTGSKQISESSMVLAEGATEQSSAVEELTTTISTINEQTHKNAESAAAADKLSIQSQENAACGRDEMHKMLMSMDSINDSSNNIAKIMKVIDDIAFQTNLLALNAAVEAARAGEHGKGFAVVAEEVRNLAGRSQTSAKETASLIEDSILKVNQGTKIAKDTSIALEKIVSDISAVSNIISDIAVSSKAQSKSVAEITNSLNQISQVVQNNSATSEESAAAAQELSSQSETLKAMLADFQLK